MRKKSFLGIITFGLLFITAMQSYGQVTVKGTIVDGANGEPMIGVTILQKGTNNGVVSDYDGSFNMEVAAIPTILEFSYIGYKTEEITVEKSNQRMDLRMVEEVAALESVEIVGQRISDKQKAAPLTVESLDAIAIKQTASTDFYNGLGSLKGVDLTTASIGFTVINTRGFNSTSPVRSLQIIDGVDNQSPGLNFSLGNFLGAPELDIQKVDLVVGASSAFYGPNAFNGVISMETKNPFFHEGLSASVKFGERNLAEGAFRFAQKFNNRDNKPFIAYKLNFSHLKAYDWVADNYDPISSSEGNTVFAKPIDNPGGFDAVNVYGDQSYKSFALAYDSRSGLNRIHRTGYNEIDLVDYNTKNTKMGAAVHFRIKPSLDFESPELILSSNFGSGTTVYQGDNRFSLRGIKFFQQKIEFRKKDKYFVRVYATNEDAGDSYDPYFTALKLQEASKSNDEWANDYETWWTKNNLGAVFKRMKALGYGDEGTTPADLIKWQQEHRDSLVVWHQQASNYANQGQSINSSVDYFKPGTVRFDSLFNDIVSRKNNAKENGTRFFDKSALYHAHAEYRFEPSWCKEWIVGSNIRMYRPNSEGTIFSDSTKRITNTEFGVYTGGSKELGDFILSAALRMDKNQNFDFLFSPAASLVWKPSKNNYLRLSFSSAIRNPTLSDQYLNLKVGPATLLGNINGFDNLFTYDNFVTWTENPNTPLTPISIAPIRPEKVRTLEVGYRTTLFEKLFVDASYYYNTYNDFIGYQIGLEIPTDTIYFPVQIVVPRLGAIKAARVAANSSETVNSQGFAVGLNYYFGKYYAVNGNYSFNELTTATDDPIVPAFNTPKNKYNVGLSGRDMPIGWHNVLMGFNVNYKWIQGFEFTGSPQFTGQIPTYDLVDAQVNFTIPKINSVLKLGASNILNNKQFQTYGGPRIGRMAYVSLVYDFKKKS